LFCYKIRILKIKRVFKPPYLSLSIAAVARIRPQIPKSFIAFVAVVAD